MVIRNPFETIPEDKPPEMEAAEAAPEVAEVADEEIEAVTLRPPAFVSPEFLLEEQLPDEVEAKEVQGFKGMEVAYTLAKKISHRDKGLPNEDTALADTKNGLLGVFDGLGGVKGSARASALAAKEFPDAFRARHLRALLRADEDIFAAVQERLNRRTQERILLRPAGKYPEEIQAIEYEQEQLFHILKQDVQLAAKTLGLLEAFEDIGQRILATETKTETTGCVGFIHEVPDGKRYAVIGNVGDSGAFVIHKNGAAKQITRDGSLVNEQIESHALEPIGLLTMKQQPQKQFTLTIPIDGEKKTLPFDYLTLGSTVAHTLGRNEPVAVELTVTELEPGDDIVFCTDGVIDKYETMPYPSMTAEELMKKPLEIEELGSDFRASEKLTGRIKELRLNAIFRRAYKHEDDIAIVAAHIPEEEKDEPKT